MSLKPADRAPNSSSRSTDTRADRSPSRKAFTPRVRPVRGDTITRLPTYSRATALAMARAIMASWNMCRMDVDCAISVSIAWTKRSMCAANASACTSVFWSTRSWASQRPRNRNQSACTSRKLVRDASDQGTNSGREGSPVRSSSRLRSNRCAISAIPAGSRCSMLSAIR